MICARSPTSGASRPTANSRRMNERDSCTMCAISDLGAYASHVLLFSRRTIPEAEHARSVRSQVNFEKKVRKQDAEPISATKNRGVECGVLFWLDASRLRRSLAKRQEPDGASVRLSGNALARLLDGTRSVGRW